MSPISILMVVVFPAPFGPDEPEDLPLLHGEGEVVDGVDAPAAEPHLEGLREPLGPQDHRAHHPGGARRVKGRTGAAPRGGHCREFVTRDPRNPLPILVRSRLVALSRGACARGSVGTFVLSGPSYHRTLEQRAAARSRRGGAFAPPPHGGGT